VERDDLHFGAETERPLEFVEDDHEEA
jgi:hypothetical protein